MIWRLGEEHYVSGRESLQSWLAPSIRDSSNDRCKQDVCTICADEGGK